MFFTLSNTITLDTTGTLPVFKAIDLDDPTVGTEIITFIEGNTELLEIIGFEWDRYRAQLETNIPGLVMDAVRDINMMTESYNDLCSRMMGAMDASCDDLIRANSARIEVLDRPL